MQPAEPATDAAFRLAEEKIAAAQRDQATELDLSNVGSDEKLKLTELPKSLGTLKQLHKLDLSNNSLSKLPDVVYELRELQRLEVAWNGLTEVPDWLGELTQLSRLNLSSNKLLTLPRSLCKLSRLESLFLPNNQLTRLPDCIVQLQQLKLLSLPHNALSRVPESLGRLTQLQELYLADNKLAELPDAITKLTKLYLLNISNNQLTVLPESIGRLTQLTRLYAFNNRLRTLPDSVGQLSTLERLDLGSNKLTELPESLLQLNSLNQLFLHNNPGLGLSNDILGPTRQTARESQPADPRAILAFYFSQRKSDAKPLNEVKMLLLGHGRVGKTSLSKALRGIGHDDRELETPGIERNPLTLTRGRSKITAHIWDFGGQEFLHQTHQFFFSERSIYVVVLTGRQGRPMQEAEYWLRLIRTYGSGSPVVIVLNQIKAHPFTIDEYFLEENYPEIKAIVKTDCAPRVGIEPLRKQLGELAASMPSVREKIDPGWARVRTRLENMEASFVTFAEYRQICTEEGVKGVEAQDTLATILDCLGIALNYRHDPRLRDTSVLKPRWLVDGIYSILRWLHKNETNGEMRLEDFSKALKSKKAYPPKMHRFLLALMEKFELCFALDPDAEVFLVPGLLNENQPRELKRFMGQDARRIQFRYEDVRPPGLLPRLIVRSHTLSERQTRWLRGVVLARGTARALVRGDHEGRVTDVFALGDDVADRVWLTEFILSEMRILHDKLPVRTFVETMGRAGVWAELEILREESLRPWKIRTERAADGTMVMVDAKQTLREVESAEASTPKENPLSVFICYAHANERAVRQLIPSLKVLARRGYIAPWRDTDLVPGEDWDDTIKERLTQADIILFMVSTDFLASKYITEQERPLAMALMNEGKAVVVPVLLSPCSWRDEDFARLEKLPRKDDPISSISPRDAAWFMVEEGLKKVVAQTVSKHDNARGMRNVSRRMKDVVQFESESAS